MTAGQPATTPLGAWLTKLVLEEEILAAMGLESLPEAEQRELYQTMVATIQDRVIAHVLDELEPAERDELGRLFARGDDTAVEAYLAEHVQNLDAIMDEEAMLYKTEMIQNARHVRAVLGLSDLAENSREHTGSEPAPPAGGHTPGVKEAVQPSATNLPVPATSELPATVTPASPPAVYHPDEQ